MRTPVTLIRISQIHRPIDQRDEDGPAEDVAERDEGSGAGRHRGKNLAYPGHTPRSHAPPDRPQARCRGLRGVFHLSSIVAEARSAHLSLVHWITRLRRTG
mgnify:CR=1 FL=1